MLASQAAAAKSSYSHGFWRLKPRYSDDRLVDQRPATRETESSTHGSRNMLHDDGPWTAFSTD